MKKRVLSLFLAITLCLSLTPTGALAEESLPEQTVAATQKTETPTLAPQKEEPLPEQTVAATQETETPTPAPQKEEPTAPAKNGADENASPASPDEKPTENTPAAAEKNSADEEPGKEPAAATGRDEPKADGSPSDDDAAKVQDRLVMAAAAGPDEPTMMGQNNLLEEERSATVELTVNEAVVEAASVTKADGTVSGTYESLPAALNAAQNGDTVKLLENHTTNWSDVEAGEYDTLAVVKKALTLDLNGWTIDYLKVGEVISDEAGGIIDSYDGNLTVVESSQGTTGKIIDLNFIKGTLDIQGGAIGADPSSTEGNSGQLTCNGNSSSVTIGGGTVYGVTVRDGASVIVSGGSMHEGNWFNDGTLTITGGTFDSVSFRNNGGTIAIRGGTFGEITNENASGKIPVMSLLADGYAFYGKDADGKYTVLQDSRKTTLENVKVLEHTDHAFLNGACIACGALTCNEKTERDDEGGCIAHVTIENYTWHLKTLDQIAYHLSAVGQWSSNYETVTVEFLSDVTTDTPFRINQCLTLVTLDLNGHTISGELSSSPVAEVNYEYGTQRVILQNGTIENTAKNGTALQLSGGATTLENVNVKGDLVLTYNFAGRASYIPTFLGGGSFTRICPVNEVDTWSKELKDMLGTGCCFLDSAGSRIDAERWFGSGDYSEIKELVNVRVKACDHKDDNGKYTLFQDATMSYGSPAKLCTLCGNLCTHDEITEGQNPTCVACGLPIVIKTTNLLNGKAIGPWYYTGLNDAMYEILHVNKGRRPTLELLADTESDSSYEWMTNDYDGIFIDLAGHTLTLTGDKNKASYWVTIQNTSDTHAEVRGTVNVYHKDNRSKLVILDTDNNLTIEEVKFVGDGTAQFAGGSFGKITVPAGKPLASLLVSGYYFADSTSSEPAALYDEDGNALTELQKVTVKPCSHNEAIYVPADGGAWKCFCGQNTFVASVTTKDGATTLYTDLQEAFSAADGGTVKLMKNERGDVTVDTDQPFTLDLNGYNIYKLTVNSKITLKDSSEGEGKIVENLIVEAEGLTVGDLLEEGYAFRSCSDNSWYGETLKTVGNARVQQVPITSVTAVNPTVTVQYGETETLTATVVPSAEEDEAVSCQWYRIGGTEAPVEGATGSTYQLPADLTGTCTYRLTATKDGYRKSCDFTVTVTPVSLEGATVVVGDLTYNGKKQTPEVTVKLGEKVLMKDKDYTLTDAEQTNADSYKLTITGKGGYNGAIENVDWKIEPKTVTNPTINVAPCVYNGSEQKPSVELKDGEAVIPEGEYTVEYSNNVNAGNGTVTITDKDGGNYVVSGSTTFPIEQTSINTSNRWIEVRVFNELAKTYEVELQPNLDNILYEQRIEGTFGTITYFLDDNGASTYEDYYELGTAEIKDGKLILPIKNGSGVPGGNYIVTLMLRVESTNFKSFDLPVHIIARDKIVPRLAEGSTVSATDITYGQTLADSTLTVTGSMEAPSFDAPSTIQKIKGTFAWTDGTVRPDKAGDYQAEWIFTPAEGYEEYATATGNTTVKVNKAAIPTSAITAPTAQENLTYTGQEQALIIAGSVTDYGTMQYSLTENGTYSQDIPTGTDAGAYTVWYRVIGDANHNDTAPASVAVRIGQKPLPITGVTAESKPYDGTTNADISSVTFDNVTLNRGTDYTVTANFDDAGVGNDKNITATVTLMGQAAKNYVLEQSSFYPTASITKAAAPRSDFHPAVTVINDLAKTYEMLLTDSYLPKLSSPCGYGNVSYSLRGTYLTDGYKDTVQAEVVEENSQYKLKLTVPAVDYDKVSSVGTIDVRVTSDNYQYFYLTIGVKTKNKDVPVPNGTISASDITYGQALNDSKIAGKMKAGGKAIDGTFTWTNGTFKPAAGDYTASWTFTPAEGYEEYATATGIVTVTVNPKAVTVSITPNGGTYGETITPATATANGVVGEDALAITLTYTGTANDGTEYTGTTPPTKAGTYTITATINDPNYTLDAKTTTAEFTVAKRRATITPDNKTKVYEEKDPDLTYAVSGVLDGKTLKGITLTRAEGENAGKYAITATADAGANPNYDVKFVEGKFTINPKSIDGATVKLGEGLTANGEEQTQTVDKVMLGDKEIPADSYTVTGNTATDPGRYTLTVTAKGNYTDSVEQTYAIAPAKAEDAPGEEIAIGSGKVNVDVQSEGAVPPAALLTDKAELLAMLVDSGDITADELAQIADGASVDIVLTVKEANVPDEVKTAMAQAAKDYTIGQYLDISLFKYMTVNGSQQAGVALHTTKDVLTISVVVPDALINTNSAVIRTYYIVRNHEGTITVLDAAFDAANKTLTFKTDRFSDYAIAYKDTAVPSSGSNPGSNNSSNDSETKKNEVAAPTPASSSKPSTITAMPQTGDTSNPTLYVVLLVASLLGLAVVFVCKKRNDK